MAEQKPGCEDLAARVTELEAAAQLDRIENRRLFNELRERNREGSTVLELQTATGQVPEVISRTRGDLSAAFETLQTPEPCG